MAARANFIAESTASAPVLAKKTASSPAAGGGERLGEHAGERRVVDLDAVDEVGGERRLQHVAHVGMVVAEAGEALAGVEVEVGAAVGVVEVGAPRRGVVLVEAEDRSTSTSEGSRWREASSNVSAVRAVASARTPRESGLGSRVEAMKVIRPGTLCRAAAGDQTMGSAVCIAIAARPRCRVLLTG